MINEIDYEFLSKYKIYCLNTGLTIHSSKGSSKVLRGFQRSSKKKIIVYKNEEPPDFLKLKRLDVL